MKYLLRWLVLCLGLMPPGARAQSCECEVSVPPNSPSFIALPCQDGTVSLATLLPAPPVGSVIYRVVAGRYDPILFDANGWTQPNVKFGLNEGVLFQPPPGLAVGALIQLKFSGVKPPPDAADLSQLAPVNDCRILGLRGCQDGANATQASLFPNPLPGTTVYRLANGVFQTAMYDDAIGWDAFLNLGSGGAFLVCHNARVPSLGLGFYCATRTRVTRQAGLPDDFTGPPESPQPSAGLRIYTQNLSGGVPLGNFDSCGSPAAVAHTFTNLPECVTGARLMARVKACGDSFNDGLELLFVGPTGKPENLRWSKPFGGQGQIPGFTPDIWEPPAVLNLDIDLDALPPGTGDGSLVNRMSVRGFLDVHVRQNTAVDFLRLEMEVCEARPPVVKLVPASQTNAFVTFSDPPTFGAAGAVKVTCSPPSGSLFPLGTTYVRCLAEDAQGQTARTCFQVVVSQIPFADRLEIVSGPVGPLAPVPLGIPATFTVEARGRGPLTYQWLHNGAAIPGATAATLVLPSIRPLDGGRYTVLIGDGRGFLESPMVPLIPELPPLPASDAFLALDAGALTNRINGLKGSGLGSVRGATAEPGEPEHAGYAAVASRWLSWFPDVSGIATFETVGSGFDTRLAVYRLRSPGLAPSLANLQRVRANDNFNPTNHNSRVAFNVQGNDLYFIAVDAADIVRGHFLLGWSMEATSQRLPEISLQPGPRAAALGEQIKLDLGLTFDDDASRFEIQWFRNNQPLAGATNPALVLPSFNKTDLGQYYAELRQIYPDGSQRVVITDPADLQHHQRSRESDGDILAADRLSDLQRQILSRPRRGAPAGGFQPRGLSAGVTGQQIYRSDYSSREVSEPLHCGQPSERTTWYALIADTDGVISIDTQGSDFDTVLAVYFDTVGELDPYNGLREVTCNDDVSSTLRTSGVQFCATGLNTYYVAVAGKANSSGLCVLNYAMTRVVSAADCEPLEVGCPTHTGLHIARPGSTVKLSAKVSGNLPIGYAWLKDGAFFQNTPGPELALVNVQAVSAGRYGLSLTNASGRYYRDVARVEVSKATTPSLGYEIPCEGGLRLIVYGDDKVFHVIEESADAIQWSAILTAQPSGGKLEHLVTLNGYRTYRARFKP